MRAVIIINPTAGRGAAGRSVPQIRELLRASDIDWVWRYTQASGDAERMAREAVAEGVPLVVAVGGDGTLHEVVNGILGSSAELALIPFGTGNDFARGIGLHGDIERACRAAISGQVRRMDVGCIEGVNTGGRRHFLVICGTGFVAQTAQTVNSGIRFLTGPLAYVYGALATLRRFSPFDLTLTTDDGAARKVKAMFVSIANVETTGGGMRIAPGAEPDDGLLDICLVEDVTKAQLAYQLTQVFKGDHVKHPAVTMLRAKNIVIEADPAQPLLIDGEVIGTTPATVTILPGVLPMRVPDE